MKHRQSFQRFFLTAGLSGYLFLAWGCGDAPLPGPISPTQISSQPQSLAKGGGNTGSSGGISVTTEIKPIPRKTRSSNGYGGTASKYMTTSSGGTLDYMGHRMSVPKNALSQNQEMYITDVSSDWVEANYGPSQWFLQPVTITISYADADLKGVDIKKMTVAWYSEILGVWIDVGGTVDRQQQTISVQVWHFTQYTLSAR